MNIQLTWTEVRIASMVGIERNICAAERGYTPSAGQARSAVWADDFIGALGEIAVAKLLGLYPKLEADAASHRGDLAGRIEVRTTSTGCLIVRPQDPDDRPYVMVCGTPPHLMAPGWLYGFDAKQDRYWSNGGKRPGAWFVPAAELQPMTELRRVLFHAKSQ